MECQNLAKPQDCLEALNLREKLSHLKEMGYSGADLRRERNKIYGKISKLNNKIKVISDRARRRCEDKNCSSYRWYGAKGVKFFLTLEDIKNIWERDNAKNMDRPSIDRINSKGNYEFSNCRFIEWSENARGSSGNKFGRRVKREDKTYCINGHKLDDKNLYLTKNGYRSCRTCTLESVKRYYKRNPR